MFLKKFLFGKKLKETVPIPAQYIKIWNTNWRYLIILDACRYDYFKKLYASYSSLQDSKLEKVISCGSSTSEWLRCTFENKICNDIIYISANPYINSKGICMEYIDLKHYHFYKIIDVWNFGWNEKLGTVHPKEVNKAALIAIKLYKTKRKRFIIHYLQPHYPYISLEMKGIGIGLEKKRLFKSRPRYLRDRVKGFIRWRLIELFGPRRGLNLACKLVGTLPTNAELIAKRIGIHGLRKAYEDNLNLALSYVAKLVENLRGKIIVTSDHGELLGEEGMYEHLDGIRHPKLIEVPWLEVNR